MKIFKVAIIVFSMFMVGQVSAQDSAKIEKKAKNKFNQINTDKDDFLSETEFEEYYKGKTTKKGKAMNSQFMFFGLDKDDDKKITLEEMIKGVDKDLAKSKMKAFRKANKN
jgi:Ca2+-binding EF-hand superfamily protein